MESFPQGRALPGSSAVKVTYVALRERGQPQWPAALRGGRGGGTEGRKETVMQTESEPGRQNRRESQKRDKTGCRLLHENKHLQCPKQSEPVLGGSAMSVSDLPGAEMLGTNNIINLKDGFRTVYVRPCSPSLLPLHTRLIEKCPQTVGGDQ